MYLKKISISNYKNIESADLEFSPVLNCFAGDNGEGKTNLLDGIYYLSMCKSRAQTTDNQNIRNSEPYFMLKGEYQRHENEVTVLCGMKRAAKKSFKVNGKECERLSDHIGYIPVVMITPADIALINGGSDERRRFLNSLLSQIDKQYLDCLLRYNNALAQRNKLLKGTIADPDGNLLEVLNMQMAHNGTIIYQKRKDAIKDFIPVFQTVYNAVSDSKEPVDLKYKSDAEVDSLENIFAQNTERDRLLQYTSAGIHRDDIAMHIDGRNLSKAASQGQQKTYLVAMKMSQFKIMQRHTGLPPILLLDDIFDKLDPGRVEKLIRIVATDSYGQIFITDCNKNRIDKLLESVTHNYKLFEIKQGNAVISKSKPNNEA